MVAVNLWSGLRPFADGQHVVEVEASTVGELLAKLERKYPGLADPIEAGISVAVDGKIIAQSLTAEIKPDSEVYLLQRIKGG